MLPKFSESIKKLWKRPNKIFGDKNLGINLSFLGGTLNLLPMFYAAIIEGFKRNMLEVYIFSMGLLKLCWPLKFLEWKRQNI